MTDSGNAEYVEELIHRALIEDLGTNGDITSAAIFSATDQAEAVIRSKAEGILSGTAVLKPLFSAIDTSVRLDLRSSDGDRLSSGTEICRLSGPVRAILSGERIALNFLQRLSGVATQTGLYVAAIAHTGARLLDTRKTTPTLRRLEKMAVLHGGGCNHRSGLFDMVLIKDTHVKYAGSVTAALRFALTDRERRVPPPKIEVEVQSRDEFLEALPLRPERIMLDNMSLDDMRACVAEARASGVAVELEASGNVSLDTVAGIAGTGVDFISVGAITHSAPALDIHLVIV